MEKKGFVHTLPFKLICALAVGIVLGLALHVTDTSPLSGVVLNVIVEAINPMMMRGTQKLIN